MGGDQQWDRARAPKRLKKKKKEKRRRGQNQETLPRPRERKKKKRARSRTLPAIQKLKEKHPDDEYLWDDYFDFMSYEEEVEAADAECDFICEDCDFGDADVVYYCAEG